MQQILTYGGLPGARDGPWLAFAPWLVQAEEPQLPAVTQLGVW